MSILRALGAVASGMFGVRRSDRAATDFARLRPWHIAIAVVMLVGCFVLSLIFLARNIAS